MDFRNATIFDSRKNVNSKGSSSSSYLRPPRKIIGATHGRFFVSVCDDVLFEVLSSGRREQLFILTKNGKRISRLVERFFVSASLLRMDIVLWHDYRFNLHAYLGIS